MAKRVESEAKALLEKEKPETVTVTSGTGITLSPSDLATSASGITVSSSWTSAGITSLDLADPMTEAIKSIVRAILEEEGVLIGISGKAKKYSQTKISISKLDQNVEDLKVIEESSPIDFLEELKKI